MAKAKGKLLEGKRNSTPMIMEDRTIRLKPTRYHDWLTISELARVVGKDVSWIRRLERQQRIPVAARVRCGELEVRLWSPKQVSEIQTIMAGMKPGRPKGT